MSGPFLDSKYSLPEVLEEMDLASSGVKQKNSSSADDDSPNFLDFT